MSQALKAPPLNSATCVQCGCAFTPHYPHRSRVDQACCSKPCESKRRMLSPEVIAANFWARVQKTDGCWLWLGAKQWNGYGSFNARPYGKRNAHRWSWALTHGHMPERAIDVCHSCDNRLCVRPDHLFLGSRLDNMQDAASKGRLPKGEEHPNAKLSSEQVERIRDQSIHVTNTSLAGEYGVSPSLVSMIRAGKRWSPTQTKEKSVRVLVEQQ